MCDECLGMHVCHCVVKRKISVWNFLRQTKFYFILHLCSDLEESSILARSLGLVTVKFRLTGVGPVNSCSGGGGKYSCKR